MTNGFAQSLAKYEKGTQKDSKVANVEFFIQIIQKTTPNQALLRSSHDRPVNLSTEYSLILAQGQCRL